MDSSQGQIMAPEPRQGGSNVMLFPIECKDRVWKKGQLGSRNGEKVRGAVPSSPWQLYTFLIISLAPKCPPALCPSYSSGIGSAIQSPCQCLFLPSVREKDKHIFKKKHKGSLYMLAE